ncbi:Glycosyl transferase, group 2 family, partial [human gut metagenome]
MGWMFDRVERMDRKYDAFLIFDADNLVHPQFMLEMNDHLEKGESVIQGYLNSKNPTDSWVAG